MKQIRIGVNIDHVATVRNARGELYPSPLRAALLSEKNGIFSLKDFFSLGLDLKLLLRIDRFRNKNKAFSCYALL